MVDLLLLIVECRFIKIYNLDINSTILSPHVKNAGVLKAIEKAHSGLLPPESRINTGFVAVVLTAHVPIAGITHKRSNEAFIYYNTQACCCSLRSQQHSCGSVQELVQMKWWLGDSLAVFTKRPALLAVVPCIVS